MSLRLGRMVATEGQRPQRVFLSASIPDAGRWTGSFDPLEITDAVTALTRVILGQGGQIITAAHPTIAPLVLYIAAEFPPVGEGPAPIVVYQSSLFEDVLPAATQRFEEEGVGRLVWTPEVEGERPEPGAWGGSLRVMREKMLRQTSPDAAVFIGGMDGISEEFALFRELFPRRPVYALGRPGGEAPTLLRHAPPELRDKLRHESAYPAIWRQVSKHLARRVR